MAAPSWLRGGNSLAEVGLTNVWTLSGPLTNNEFAVVEPGLAARLMIPRQGRTGTSTRAMMLTDFAFNGAKAISGVVPATLFWPTNGARPWIGLEIDSTAKPTIQASGNVGVVQPSLECAGRRKDGRDRSFAPLIACGPPAAQTVPISGSGPVTFTMTVTKAFFLGQLHMNKTVSDTGGLPLEITSIEVNGDKVFNNATPMSADGVGADALAAPWYGQGIQRGAVITVTVLSTDGVNATTDVCPCFTAIDPWDDAVTDEMRQWLRDNQ